MINRKILFNLILLSSLFFYKTIEAEGIKPKVNKNTQIITKYGCERPKQWQTKERIIKINNEQVKCLINTRDYVLYNNSITEPVMEVKKCRKNKLCCKLIEGEWIVKDLEGKKINIKEKNKLHIDHILPFNYIRLNMSDCKNTINYYNYIYNLKPELALFNTKKSDNLCDTEEECGKQKLICLMMAQEFNDDKLCEELNQVIEQ